MQKNRKKTRKAVGNSNNQNNQTKEVTGIVAHVESLNDLISLLPLPPSHPSESENIVVKCEEQNNEVSSIVDVSDDDTDEKSSLIEQIAELQLARETLEKEKRVLIEQMTVKQTEELEKNASIQELQQIVSTLRSRNEFLEQPLPGRIHMIKKHQKEVAELNQKIDSQAKENEKVVSTLRSQCKTFEQLLYNKDHFIHKHKEKVAELNQKIDLQANQNERVILSIQQEHEKEKSDLMRRHEKEMDELRNEYLNSSNTRDRYDSNSSYSDAWFLRPFESDEDEETNKLVVDQQKHLNGIQEQKSSNLSLLSRIWSGFSNLCWNFKNHFMRQRLRWKIVYIASLLIAMRSLPNRKPDYCRSCYILMR